MPNYEIEGNRYSTGELELIVKDLDSGTETKETVEIPDAIKDWPVKKILSHVVRVLTSEGKDLKVVDAYECNRPKATGN